MTYERCNCGDTDCRRCYPYMPTTDDLDDHYDEIDRKYAEQEDE